MSSEIDIFSSMSSKFNLSESSENIDDIDKDKTLKWRRLKNNKFASARRGNLSEGNGHGDVSDSVKHNRVLRKNKQSVTESKVKNVMVRKNKIIKTRGVFIRRGRKQQTNYESIRLSKGSEYFDNLNSVECFEDTSSDDKKDHAEKMETKLRRSERTQNNSPLKIEDVTDVIERKLEQDFKIEPVSTIDQFDADDVNKKSKMTNDQIEIASKLKPEPSKRGRKKPTASSTNDSTDLSCSINEEYIKREIVEKRPNTENDGIKHTQNEIKIPKKRGRKPGTKLKPKYDSTQIFSRNLPVKKSARISKDGSDSILSRKEKCNEQAVQPQRLSRRIKPTPKILANEELRYGFEIQNNARLSISSENLDKVFGEQISPPKTEIRRSIDDQKVPPSYETVIMEQTENVKVDSKKLNFTIQQRPCPDPIEFLNEIKLAKINLNRSPEDNKKLNVKQKRRLIKMKEKLFSKLGLQRTNQTINSSGTSDSDADEFVPAKKIQVSSQPGVTLRIRRPTPDTKAENKINCESTPKCKIDSSDNDCNNPEDRSLKRKLGNNLLSRAKEKCITDILSPDVASKESKIDIPPSDTTICLCKKSSNYYTRKTIETRFCRAIDEIDNEYIGCSNEVEGDVLKLHRPSVRALYMILCKAHKERLAGHNSCAGCGIFCTSGRFILCSKNHFFHRDCAIRIILGGPFDPQNNKFTCPTLLLKCPHCGNDAPMQESLITMKCKNIPVYLPKQKICNELSAKMSIGRHTVKSAPKHSSFLMDLETIIPLSIVNLLNKMKIKLNYSKSTSFTTKDVLYAVHTKDIAQLAEILASGFDITTLLSEFRNGTCLHLVSNFGDVTMTYLTLSRAKSIDFLNFVDADMRTATMCAVVGHKYDILKLLLQCGADVTIKGPEGMTVLHLAAKNGNLTAVKIILEHYRSFSLYEFEQFVNTIDQGGWTAIVWAAEIGNSEMVTYFLNHGADVTIKDTESNSLLHWATMSNDVDTVGTILLNRRCNVNGQNMNGDTAMHIACRNSNANICMLLLAHEASMDITNKEGNCPYDNIRDKENICARVLHFNSMIRKNACDTEIKILDSDISKGREWYPIKVVKKYSTKERNLHGYELDHHLLPDFKYITKSIILQNFIQIDHRVAQMRICCCSDNCVSESCQCSDVSLQNYYTAEGRLNDKFNYKEPNKPMIFECNDVCGCNKMICRNRVVQQGSRCALQIVESIPKSKGWGVITMTRILKGTFIAEYTGEILRDSEADRRTDDSYFFDLGAEHCIDANLFGNVSRFFNHSCEPNIIPIRVYFEHQDLSFPKIAFFASENIDAGVELCFDYGEKFWIHKVKSFTCQCGAQSCRFSEKMIKATLDDYICERRTGLSDNI